MFSPVGSRWQYVFSYFKRLCSPKEWQCFVYLFICYIFFCFIIYCELNKYLKSHIFVMLWSKVPFKWKNNWKSEDIVCSGLIKPFHNGAYAIPCNFTKSVSIWYYKNICYVVGVVFLWWFSATHLCMLAHPVCLNPFWIGGSKKQQTEELFLVRRLKITLIPSAQMLSNI